ncbi:hypothetical protein VTN77DRAFT_6443 [Rasamsonia byssochlamydoides]|uniref:uncharacterized protein n=1 Tax=Rasamsonia byssochlamydoides TaxID=89139 RepID=UPI003742526F
MSNPDVRWAGPGQPNNIVLSSLHVICGPLTAFVAQQPPTKLCSSGTSLPPPRPKPRGGLGIMAETLLGKSADDPRGLDRV